MTASAMFELTVALMHVIMLLKVAMLCTAHCCNPSHDVPHDIRLTRVVPHKRSPPSSWVSRSRAVRGASPRPSERVAVLLTRHHHRSTMLVSARPLNGCCSTSRKVYLRIKSAANSITIRLSCSLTDNELLASQDRWLPVCF